MARFVVLAGCGFAGGKLPAELIEIGVEGWGHEVSHCEGDIPISVAQAAGRALNLQGLAGPFCVDLALRSTC